MNHRLDPRALVLSALLVAPAAQAIAQDAGTNAAPPPDPHPVCRARVCPEWTRDDRPRVLRRTPPPPPTSTTPPASSR